MSNRKAELVIANRLVASSEGGRNTMLRIASAAVAVSMAVMIVAMSVIGGFRIAITDRLSGFAAHVKVENLQSASLTVPAPITRNADFENKVRHLPHFSSITPFTDKNGIIKSRTAMQGVRLVGVTDGYDSLFYRRYLVEGSLPRVGGEERYTDILISRALSDLLQAGVGSKVEMIFIGSNTPLRRDAYKVVGIYSTGMAEMDRLVTVTDMRNVQRLCSWAPEQISGYEIMADDIRNMEHLAGDVRVEALYAGGNETWRTSDLKTNYPYFFDWLATHDINAVVIIAIMLIVALLNMISALLIIIFEKIQMIGVLKALGMRDGSIQRIFLWRSLSVVLRGMLWGNVAGLALIAFQWLTGAIKLDAEAYLLTRVPVSFGWDWWLGLNVGVPVLLLLLLAIPVAVVSRIRPDQTLKYK